MTFIPYADKVVIKPIKREEVIPTADAKFEEMGEVLAVGADVTFVKVGDTVFFRPFGYTKTPEVDGERHYVVTIAPEFILGKIEK